MFLVSDFIGRRNRWDSNPGFLSFTHLTRPQIRELVQAGWTIGSHTRSHRCLIGMVDKQLKSELKESRKILEDLSGHPVEYIVPPFGKADRRVIETALDCGYRKILLPLTFYRLRFPDSNCLYRWNIYATDSEKSLATRLSSVNSKLLIGRQMVITFCNNASIATVNVR